MKFSFKKLNLVHRISWYKPDNDRQITYTSNFKFFSATEYELFLV